MKTSEVLSVLSRDELKQLLKKSDGRALAILAFNWILITSCFASVHYFPYWWVWLFASVVLAGRILGLAILMHDCSHDGFFKTKWMNRFFGKWFCAAPVLADLDRYRIYHLEHHRTAGSDADPDRSNYASYPVSKRSFKRKVLRDLFGVTGIKLFILVLKMNAGTVKYQLSYDGSKQNQVSLFTQFKNIAMNLWLTFLIHSVAIYFLRMDYLLFWFSWLTFYMLFSRIRNSAEHGATKNIHSLNPLLNTRTTLARPWERLIVAPNYVNYHLEHHLLPAIPSYHLQAFHKLLWERGALKETTITSGYRQVVSELIA